MEIEIQTSDNLLMILCSGRMTFMDDTISDSVLSLIKDTTSKTINIDLSQLSFVDSSGLGMMIKWHHECKEFGKSIDFLNPSDAAFRALKAGRLDKYLPIQCG